jgi:hypothetical protein
MHAGRTIRDSRRAVSDRGTPEKNRDMADTIVGFHKLSSFSRFHAGHGKVNLIAIKW